MASGGSGGASSILSRCDEAGGGPATALRPPNHRGAQRKFLRTRTNHPACALQRAPRDAKRVHRCAARRAQQVAGPPGRDRAADEGVARRRSVESQGTGCAVGIMSAGTLEARVRGAACQRGRHRRYRRALWASCLPGREEALVRGRGPPAERESKGTGCAVGIASDASWGGSGSGGRRPMQSDTSA